MNIFKNISVITFYFISMICFVAGYVAKDSYPLLYFIAMLCGLVFSVIGFLRRSNK